MAEAPPPPLQILATPLWPGCRLKGVRYWLNADFQWYRPQRTFGVNHQFLSLDYLYTRWFTILAPLAPRGWPRLTAPPWMFTLHQCVVSKIAIVMQTLLGMVKVVKLHVCQNHHWESFIDLPQVHISRSHTNLKQAWLDGNILGCLNRSVQCVLSTTTGLPLVSVIPIFYQ